MTDAGLYVHVPFCTSVCPYCDFAVTIAGDDRRQGYLGAFVKEVVLARDHGLRYDTVYLGGGTPSSLTPSQIGEMLRCVAGEIELAHDCVLHLEINPEDVTDVAADAWRALGIEFASVGVQSFDDHDLDFLGRRHRAAAAERAVRSLVAAGFTTVSVDLIFGLPGQTPGDWRHQIETALALGIHHLSCYQLTIHRGTVFGRRLAGGELRELDEDRQAELYLLTHEVLAGAGWQGYEVSNFAARPAHRSRHNQKYWNHSPYVGLGPSAHSFVGRTRWWNRRKVRRWTAALEAGSSPIEGMETLTDAELFLEAVMLGLRTADGIDRDDLRRRFGGGISQFDEPNIERLVRCGHLWCDGPRIHPTPTGMAVAESVVRSILP